MRPISILALALLLIHAASFAFASVEIEEEEVVFRFTSARAERVFLVGDFNGWNPTLDMMVRTDSLFEARLFLVPGRYSYRFLVDGEPIEDRDNPCLDQGGNSCFTLFQREGVLEISFVDVFSGLHPEGGERALTVRKVASSVVEKDQGSVFADIGFEGSFERKVDLDCSIGAFADAEKGRKIEGSSVFLRAEATYRAEKVSIKFFSREGGLLEESALLPLFGRIGPYSYTVGLMSRGFVFEGKLPGGTETWLAYVSRIKGYKSPLEEAMQSDRSSSRRLLDGDAFAVRVGKSMGSVDLYPLLLRIDKWPVDGKWSLPGEESFALAGYESARRWGCRMNVRGEEGCMFESAFLFGETRRHGTEIFPISGQDFSGKSLDSRWEKGTLASIKFSRDGDRFDAALSVQRATIEDLHAPRSEFTKDELSADATVDMGYVHVSFGRTLEIYGSSGAGERFWQASENFWLDGDDLGFDKIPFFSCREVSKTFFSISLGELSSKESRGARKIELKFLHRAGAGSERPAYAETILRGEAPFISAMSLVIDLRAAFYRYGRLKRDFVNPFVGIETRLGDSAWCMAGVGVSPMAFDRWTFGFENSGRELYLEKRGIFDVLASGGESAATERLISAEEAMAEKIPFVLLAGFSF